MNSIYSKRLSKLREFLKSENEAMLITNETNIGYFCGFFHSEGAMLVMQSTAYLLVDFRYIESAQKNAECCTVICFKKLTDSVCELFAEHSVNSVYLESGNVTLANYQKLKSAFECKKVDCCISSVLDRAIADIRIIKDETEFAKILKAQQITEQAYLEVLNYVKPGVTERKIAIELEYLIRKKGAERVSFDLITITGKKTSLPHGVPSDDIINSGDFFTMDIGAVYGGYHSDTTRTVAVDFATDEMQKVYNIVLKAQKKALDVIKDGAKCSEVDKTARDIIESEGYGKFFGHATGHGVGLDIHESPAVSPNSNIVLKEGMVITDEPGIYLPDKFGVRIEDMLYVTKDGYKNFVTLPKELLIV